MLQQTRHTVAFIAEDVPVGRVEFLIRYCEGVSDGPIRDRTAQSSFEQYCRHYDQCDDEDFIHEISTFQLPTPSSIEKLVCDEDCLNGIVRSTTTIAPSTTPTTTTMNMTSMKSSTDLSSPTRLSILVRVLFVLVVLVVIVLVVCIVYRLKGNLCSLFFSLDSHGVAL